MGLESVVDSISSLSRTASASTVDELGQAIVDHVPDLVLAEVFEGAGLEVYPLLRDVESVVMLVDEHNVDSVQEAINGTGRAVLNRDATPAEITAAIQAASSGLIVLDAERAHSLISSVPVRVRGAAVQVEELTQREVEVLGLMAEGLGNKIIARRLGISEHTVKFHVASILGKLDAGSRTEAVTMGVRQGLIAI